MKSLAYVGTLAITGALAATFDGSQVLGPCGGADEDIPAVLETSAVAPASTVHALPLPGQRAANFELTAVVGSQIAPIKLSDYNGKWRVLCFYPADFTFV